MLTDTGDTHFYNARRFFHKVVSFCTFFCNLTMLRGHFVHLGDDPLRQTMFASFKLQALATSHSPEMSATTDINIGTDTGTDN